jgi:tetratricopeptide (TPR) repeat protein
VWQELRAKLAPRGVEIVTVALDTDPAAAMPWIERARPEHPSLIDVEHRLDELFGIVNVPSGVWIDEGGRIVRPPETAYPRRPAFLDTSTVEEVRRLRIDGERYASALREWAEEGRHALAPEEVLRRCRRRTFDEAAALAQFELAAHLHRAGRGEEAVEHFREAIRLQPGNWTHKRQAWKLLPPGRTSLEVYGGDWLTEVRRIGPENYYPGWNS